MERVIKFRLIHQNKIAGIERLSENGWEWMWYEINPDKGERWTRGVVDISTLPIIRNQFTGLTDKHGVEIYEGDIVECYDHPENIESGIFEVVFSHGSFSCKGSTILLRDFGTAWTKVLGNIYQHPHLLTRREV